MYYHTLVLYYHTLVVLINAYLHHQRKKGLLQVANPVFLESLDTLVQAGVLLETARGRYALPSDFHELKMSFLANL